MRGIPWWSSGWTQCFTATALGSIPGWGTHILQAAWRGQKKKKNTVNEFQSLLS